MQTDVLPVPDCGGISNAPKQIMAPLIIGSENNPEKLK